MTRLEVVMDARVLWLETRTPYLHQARIAGVATDCIGIVGGIARDRGTPEGLEWEADREAHNYGRLPHPKRLIENTERYLDRISPSAVDVADIVLMKITSEDPQHFGIISRVDPTYIIHASSSFNRVVEHRLDEKWRARILRAYRYRGIE